MGYKEFVQFVKDKMSEHPKLQDDIKVLFDIAMDEIEDGGSPWNEYQLGKESINQLIQEQS